jgi:hypothetical protein
MKTFHAYYSAKAAKQCGYAIYTLKDGTEVAVTNINESRESIEKSDKWDDKVYVGEVVKYINTYPPTWL